MKRFVKGRDIDKNTTYHHHRKNKSRSVDIFCFSLSFTPAAFKVIVCFSFFFSSAIHSRHSRLSHSYTNQYDTNTIFPHAILEVVFFLQIDSMNSERHKERERERDSSARHIRLLSLQKKYVP